MNFLTRICLGLVHVAYALYNALYALFVRHVQHPYPLAKDRRRIPKHLALLLTSDDAANQDDVRYAYERAVRDVTRWCNIVGVSRLTAYDPRGVIEDSSEVLASLLHATDSTKRTRLREDIAYPPTPPFSETSRPISPDSLFNDVNLSVTTLGIKQTRFDLGLDSSPFTLHILSPDSSTAAIAEAAQSLIQNHLSSTSSEALFCTSIAQLEGILEGETGFPAPDLMIVHHFSPAKRSRTPLELHGFPPWQIRLTEIYHDEYAATYWRWLMPWRRSHIVHLSEIEFRKALDEYASAEMRLGK